MRPIRPRLTLLLGCALLTLLTGCAREARISTNADVRRVSPAEAAKAVRDGEAVIYDVRSRDAYAAQHVVGSEPLPEAELEELYSQLPADKDLILY